MKQIDPDAVDGWVAANVRYWRKRHGMSQAELADKAGVVHSTIRNVEILRGQATPNLLARLANVFSLPMSAFLVENEFVRRTPGRPRTKLES